MAHDLDVCACGHWRKEHAGGSGRCRHPHLRPGCRGFRLAATRAEISEGWAEWRRLSEAEQL